MMVVASAHATVYCWTRVNAFVLAPSVLCEMFLSLTAFGSFVIDAFLVVAALFIFNLALHPRLNGLVLRVDSGLYLTKLQSPTVFVMVASKSSGGSPFLLNPFVYLVDASRSGGCERAVSDFWA